MRLPQRDEPHRHLIASGPVTFLVGDSNRHGRGEWVARWLEDATGRTNWSGLGESDDGPHSRGPLGVRNGVPYARANTMASAWCRERMERQGLNGAATGRIEDAKSREAFRKLSPLERLARVNAGERPGRG
jgi:hypothetical protein